MAEPALTQLGRYKILAELGRGAMGVVYRGEDPMLNRTVAIKTIIMSADAAERSEYEARFYQEAKAAGGLNHPNLITIYDIGREGDTAYMAMELLDGIELQKLMKQGRVPLRLALDLAAQVADGLAYAHERGVVHRDIKPANVMVIQGRIAKIMDFGIARMRVSEVQTQAGAVLGSPKYMSPEQVTGLRADHRSDIFSLGIVLYELLSGAAPFSAATVTGLMHNIATATQPPPSSVDGSLPSMLDLITARALEKDPEARYQSAAEIAADLRACLSKLETSGIPAVTMAPASATERTAKLQLDPAIASAEKTTRIDSGQVSEVPPLDATVAADATRVITREPERQRKADATASATRISPVMQLYLSRKANSDTAMKRLEEMISRGGVSPQEPGSGTPGFIRTTWEDRDRRIFAAAMAVAVVCAVLVVLL